MNSLLLDNQCRVCYHVHDYGTCTERDEFAEYMTGEPYIACGCEEYVDLDAESRIIIKIDEEMR